jgi:hypothetical protein
VCSKYALCNVNSEILKGVNVNNAESNIVLRLAQYDDGVYVILNFITYMAFYVN